MDDTSTSHIHNNDKNAYSKQTDAEKYCGDFLSFFLFFLLLFE